MEMAFVRRGFEVPSNNCIHQTYLGLFSFADRPREYDYGDEYPPQVHYIIICLETKHLHLSAEGGAGSISPQKSQGKFVH